MKKLLPIVVASLLATTAHGALAELNVAEGTIETPNGSFVGRSFVIPKDFKMELLHVTVPAQEGQWVALGWDNKNRLIVSSYNSDRMSRLTIPPVGSQAPIQVEPINTTRVGASEGLVHAFGGLYMNVNRSTTMRHGIYRLDDTNGDDKYDQTRIIRVSGTGGGDHGTHALQLAPDGKSIYLLAGNATPLVYYQSTRVPPLWGEDNLVMRNLVGGPGFNRAPESFVTSFDPEGKNFELFAVGMRNPVCFSFNKDGEMFLYDSDMEWDMGLPWYIPTNVQHIVSGADVGWRDGSRKHPLYYFDYFGTIASVGSGSPVGTVFGTGAKFPARYQDAFFVADWSYGNLWAVFMTPDGSSYKGDVTPFVSGSPFAVSGLTVNPQDGSLLVMTTGTQLYRITYTGSESTARTLPDAKFASARNQRHAIEAFHGHAAPNAVATIWPFLSDPDRATRFAARTALEWQDPTTWRDRALSEQDPRKLIAAIASLARLSSKDGYHTTPADPAPDKVLQSRMIAALDRIDWNALPYQDKLDLLRAYGLTFIRMGSPDQATRQRLISKFDPYLPATQRELNWELAEVLTYLEAPSAVTKLMTLLRNAPSGTPYYADHEFVNPQLRVRNNPGLLGPAGLSQADFAKQADQIQYAQLLRTLKNGWTMALREEFAKWFTSTQQWRGHNQWAISINTIRADAQSQLPADAQQALGPVYDAPLTFLPQPTRGGGGGAAVGGAAAPAARAGGPGGAPAGQ